jgi:hypothetical protein
MWRLENVQSRIYDAQSVARGRGSVQQAAAPGKNTAAVKIMPTRHRQAATFCYRILSVED